jgi:peptidoglycan/LPS O-acetylase OafA/YrhL
VLVAQWKAGGLPSTLAALGSYTILVFLPQIRIAPLIGLGAISYSLYLIHVPIGGRVINLGERWASSPIAKSATALLAFGASLLVAYILFRTVEKPSHAAAHKYWKKWSARMKDGMA